MTAAIESLATQELEELGAIFTKAEIVEGILDLCGYVETSDLTRLRLLEPSAGRGRFLFAAVERLLRSCQALYGPPAQHITRLQGCIQAVELHRITFEATSLELITLLTTRGFTSKQAAQLTESWLLQDDFLLAELAGGFDVVVGNPPYIRQEKLAGELLAEYRRIFETLYDRADLYVLFYERCLDLMKPGGVLGFICANRWVKNKYGGPLREKIARDYHLDVYIDMSAVDAFDEQVDAYPAITIIRYAPQSSTRVVKGQRASSALAQHLFEALLSHPTPVADVCVDVVHDVGCGRDPWLVDAPEILATIRTLERDFPTLEEAQAKVGIGVATGADKIYIGDYDALPVEVERRIPLVMSSDLRATHIEWAGAGLINPWLDDGGLATLEAYPRFGAYMRQHQAALKNRHTAKKSPQHWYKTIDRVYPALASTPKLLIPDIKGEATVVFDEGRYYPHHNLYVVTSALWELRALQAVLRSSVALAFVAAYCVKMSGGFLRFQAQYLRRIRVPLWDTLSPAARARLIEVSTSLDQVEIDEAVYAAYGLTSKQAQMISDFATSARVSKEKV